MFSVIIGSLLIAMMYSSSTGFVVAEFLTSCTNLNETKAHCTVIHAESYPLGSDCMKNPDGTYSCTQDQDEDQINVPSKLTDKGSYPLGSDCMKNPDGTYSCTQDQDEDNRDDVLLDNPDSNDRDVNNGNNTSAKNPNTPNPIPIPYPNTNNNTKAQITTD